MSISRGKWALVSKHDDVGRVLPAFVGNSYPDTPFAIPEPGSIATLRLGLARQRVGHP